MSSNRILIGQVEDGDGTLDLDATHRNPTWLIGRFTQICAVP